MASNTKSFYTVPEIAKDWAISEPHVWRLIRDGKLSPTRFGKRATRIDGEEKARFEQASKAR